MQLPKSPANAAGGGGSNQTAPANTAAPTVRVEPTTAENSQSIHNPDAARQGIAVSDLINQDARSGGSTSQDDTEELFQPPLQISGRYILDARRRRFKLASVNWYGGSDELFIPSGLDKKHRSEIAGLIRRMGFNSVRLPYSDEMVMKNPLVPAHLLSENRDLIGKTALDIFTACVDALTDAGLAVIPNDHITVARWCDGKSLCDAAWKNDHLGPFCSVRLTEEQWIRNWVTVMRPLASNMRVVGCDLRNEVRGIWGTMTWNMWATAAERCADQIHAQIPARRDWLMFVEGIGSANDCSGARARPVLLQVPNRVVYSVHVYAWSGWGSLDPYSRRAYPGFALAMHRNWAFLLRGADGAQAAPVWVGELGAGPAPPSQGDLHYWTNLMRFLDEWDVDFAYWAINPRKPHNNEKETWALTDDAWAEVVVDYRMEAMRKLMKPLGYRRDQQALAAEAANVADTAAVTPT